MSQENVEIVRRAISEFDNTQQLSESFAPDFVWETSTYQGAPGPFEYRGWDGFFEFFEEWVEAYDEWEQYVEEIRDGGGNQVVVAARQRGRLAGTEDWLEMRYGLVYTLEGGLIRRIQIYRTLEEALTAVGLEE